jgi:hypothetical protein
MSSSYTKQLRTTFERLVDATPLNDRQRDFVRLRWLDQLLWMESKASQAQWFYYRLRLVTIIGAVIVPALVSLNTLDGSAGTAAQIATWTVSLVVAVSAAIDGFFQFGQRWRSYRMTAERMKIEGWLFFQLAGPYAASTDHNAAFPTFAAHVEDLLQKEVDAYITEVTAEKRAASG